jgi:hypothetical protein
MFRPSSCPTRLILGLPEIGSLSRASLMLSRWKLRRRGSGRKTLVVTVAARRNLPGTQWRRPLSSFRSAARRSGTGCSTAVLDPEPFARLPATMVSGPGCKRRFTSSRCTRVPGLQLEILKASTAGEIDAAFERRRASDARLRRHARTPRPTRMSRFKMCVGNIQISKFVHTIVGKN